MDTRINPILAIGTTGRSTPRVFSTTDATAAYSTAAYPTAGATATNGTTGHIKADIVAWHRSCSPAMHHHWRPEEVASH